MASLDSTPVTFIGHPFAPIGMGEQLRSQVAAAAQVCIDCGVFDIFRYAQRNDPAHFALMAERELRELPRGIRIFHVNGDEVDRVLEAFAARGGDFSAGYNIVVPAWELPRYPQPWADRLGRFDEVWALSAFVRDSLAEAGIASHVIGQSVEQEPGVLLPRRFFGIRESAFVLLHFFDLTSYAVRKNPQGVLDLFARLRRSAPFLDTQLVLKVKNGEAGAADWARDLAADPQVRVIHTPLDTRATRSLIAAADCFVSLHRAEGFGRGLGEAMALGRLALGTAWSGNVDFMSERNALPVRHALVPVPPDAYPHWRGQVWAEPDLDHALALLQAVLDDPSRGRARAAQGHLDVLRSHGNRAVGLRMLDRLGAIAAGGVKRAPAPAAKRRRLPTPA